MSADANIVAWQCCHICGNHVDLISGAEFEPRSIARVVIAGAHQQEIKKGGLCPSCGYVTCENCWGGHPLVFLPATTQTQLQCKVCAANEPPKSDLPRLGR
jgi:hypothetical protein